MLIFEKLYLREGCLPWVGFCCKISDSAVKGKPAEQQDSQTAYKWNVMLYSTFQSVSQEIQYSTKSRVMARAAQKQM